MTKHMTGTCKEWLAARLELLKAEKELTRRSDALARQRRELPWFRFVEGTPRLGISVRSFPHLPVRGDEKGSICRLTRWIS